MGGSRGGVRRASGRLRRAGLRRTRRRTRRRIHRPGGGGVLRWYGPGRERIGGGVCGLAGAREQHRGRNDER